MPESKPNAADMLDDSWPMSESELRLQRDRPSNLPAVSEPPPPPDEEPEELTLEEAKKRLQKKVQQLVTAKPRELAELTIEIQKLRVVCMLLSESGEDNKVFDPNTYREMSMLNRMLARGGEDGEEDPAAALDDLRLEEEAAARLEKRGISREGAGRLARVLGAALSRAGAPANVNNVTPTPDEDDEGDEPDMAPESVQ